MQFCDRLSQLLTKQEQWWQQRYVLPSVPLIGKLENCFETSTYGDEAGCLGADYESGIEYEHGEINWILGIEK